MPNHHELANLIWQIADLLRGPYRPPQYERVMLPMTVLRRFDCVLAPSKAKVMAEHERRKGGKLSDEALDKVLNRAAGQRFHNHSPLTFEKLKGDPDHIDKHLVSYINGFSANVRTIFEYFEFTNEIEKMRESNILFLVVSRFCDVDLHPDDVRNEQMGLIFENLIRRFNELANETAGDHFTPREVIRLMVNILFIKDDALLATPGTVRKLLDPACGTGGMLAEAQNYLREHHPEARLYVYGQDYNKRAFATAASDMLIKQVNQSGGVDNIRFGDSFTDDQFSEDTFDYFLTNPPFGVDWKKQQKEIQREHEKLGFGGRFGAGLPRVNDGSLLFLQHMVDKFEPVLPNQHKHGSRLAIVFSGSPLFTGGAGSGESNIRKWIVENDWLEAIIALPEQMFYNTGIGTYIWIVTNRKEKRRKGKIQLLDARACFVPMRRSLGDKRRKIGEGQDGEPDQIGAIVKLYGGFRESETSKIFGNEAFGFTRVTVERPLRLRYQMTVEDKARFLDACPHLLDDVQAIDKTLGREPQRDWNDVYGRILSLLGKRRSKWKAAEHKLFRDVFTQKDPEAEPVIKSGSAAPAAKEYEPDTALRDFENVPLREDIDEYFLREVQPHVPDAWMDRSKDKVGYEINFNRHFYRYTPPRPLEEIDADLKLAEQQIMQLLAEVTAETPSSLQDSLNPLECGGMTPLSLTATPTPGSHFPAFPPQAKSRDASPHSKRPSWPHAPPHWLFSPGIYMVTAATHGKAQFLDAPERLDLLQDRLFETAAEFGWHLEAWAVLANHYHFVARSPDDPTSLRRLIGKLHMLTAKALNIMDGTRERKVWFQYWESSISFERSYLARLAYVHANPVKHGLVRNATQYPWCSASWFVKHAPRSFVETIRRMKTDRVEVPDDF